MADSLLLERAVLLMLEHEFLKGAAHHEALMLEPTETESRETLDWAAEVFRKLYDLAHADPEYMHASPHSAQIGRPDEVQAARNPILRYQA